MQISNAEWRIMKIIWMEGKQTSTDLIAVLSERFDWSKSTIKTLLTRLVKDKVCSKRIVQVLENLIQESDFTLADLNQLQQVLEEKKAEAVETVPCNCM